MVMLVAVSGLVSNVFLMSVIVISIAFEILFASLSGYVIIAEPELTDLYV